MKDYGFFYSAKRIAYVVAKNRGASCNEVLKTYKTERKAECVANWLNRIGVKA